MKMIIKWLIMAVAVIITAYVLPGVNVDSFVTALIVALVLGIISIFIKPLVKLLTLPITILTLGLFTFVIEALMILLVDFLVAGFTVDNFLWALLFALVLAVVNHLLSSLTGQKRI
jgi:putative membrane protein